MDLSESEFNQWLLRQIEQEDSPLLRFQVLGEWIVDCKPPAPGSIKEMVEVNVRSEFRFYLIIRPELPRLTMAPSLGTPICAASTRPFSVR